MNEAQAKAWMERMTSTEPLHPDLVPWYEETGPTGFPVLRHPLVYVVPYMNHAHANFVYEQKKQALLEAALEEAWFSYIHLHERPYRLYAFMKIQENLDNRTYWELLSGIWTDSENIHQNLDEWAEALGSERTYRRYFMDADERRVLRNLPDEITVYRGCHREVNEDGWSWTLDREKAEWFARRYSWRDEEPLVIEAKIKKEHVVAYQGGRGESEIIAYPHVVNIIMYHEV